MLKILRNLTDQTFGKLTAIKPTEYRSKDGSIKWLCRCECGNELLVSSTKLISEDKISCGCLRPVASRNALIKAKKANNIFGTNVGLIKKKTLRTDNKSGTTGVKWNNSKNRWISQIFFQGKEHYLGAYLNIDDAVKAR